MSLLEEIIRSESSSASIVFRERPYARVEKQAFVRDVLGLANALVDESRYLILGVKDQGPGERSFSGISDEEIADARGLYAELIERYIEPRLDFGFDVVELDGSKVAVLSLAACDQPPYLLRENLSNAMREGSGWILKSSIPVRLRRDDLLALFQKTLFGPTNQPAIAIGFPGDGPTEELTLTVLDLDAMPSRIAADKFRKLMEVRQASHDAGGRTMTRLERLVHMREFGGSQPFEAISETSLIRRLAATEDEHHWADDFYEFETRTHKVNLSISNQGEVDLRDAVLVLDLPRISGFGVSDYLRTAHREMTEDPQDYPSVHVGEHATRVQADVAAVPAGSIVQAFAVPLRIWVREAAAGQTLPVDFRLNGPGLREPATGTLRIHCR
ncbi:MAG TPA: ATP-binding protein [Gammaproteobacteria bacterium]